MLHVWRTSGAIVASVPLELAKDVLELKRNLQRQTGLSRFRQRLLMGKVVLDDRFPLHDSYDLQLVVLPFEETSPEQADALTYAAERGSLSEIEAILQRPQDPDVLGESMDGSFRVMVESDFPIIIASAFGMTQSVALLLEAGADPNPVSQSLRSIGGADIAWGKTPLIAACYNGHPDVVNLLLAAGVDPNQPGSVDSPLHEASRRGHVDVVQVLVASGADINRHIDKGCCPPLVHALLHGQVEVALQLMELGAEKFLVDGFGRSPICVAARSGHASIVKEILKASLAPLDLAGPILEAASSGRVAVLGCLVHAAFQKWIRGLGLPWQ